MHKLLFSIVALSTNLCCLMHKLFYFIIYSLRKNSHHVSIVVNILRKRKQRIFPTY